MTKFSKVSQRQRKMAGRSVSRRVVHRLPKILRSVALVTLEVEYRLPCVQHALANSVLAAAARFDRCDATGYRWMAAYNAEDIHS